MRIEIEIPKEFEEHFNLDKFKDSLERIMADIKHSLENGDCLCAGRYEYETIEMLVKALENSKSAYDIDKVVEELEKCSWIFKAKMLLPNSNELGEYEEEAERIMICIQDAIDIVKQGGVSDNVCEYRRQLEGYNSLFITSCCHIYRVGNNFKFCPHCGKKIKIVGD